MIRRPRISTLFPSTPLFRSQARDHDDRRLLEMVGLPLDGLAHPVGAERMRLPAAQPLRHRPGLTVEPGELVLHVGVAYDDPLQDRKSTRLNSSHLVISYAVF